MIAPTPVLFPDSWKPFEYHPVQAQFWQYTGRFAAVVAGRRSGKTELCRRKMVLNLPIKKPWPDPIYVYLLPTFAQAKKVAWLPILNLVPKNWIAKNGVNKSDLCITTIFGSRLYVAGADKPHRIEGIGVDGCIIDESCDQKPDLYPKTVRPMLSDRKGWCYRIGVPKRSGIGRLDFKEFYDRGKRGENGIASFFWESADILDPQEIADAKADLDEATFNEQYRAQWIDVGGGIYYAFSQQNINEAAIYDPTQEIIVGCDFNVSPMCWVLCHYIDGVLRVFDEIFLRDTNTPSTMDFLCSKYRGHQAGWKFFGDATSRARKTPATKTDYLIIKNDDRFVPKTVNFPQRNPHMRDRFACVNAALKNAKGDIRCIIHPRCKHLINDLSVVAYQEGTTEIEDYSGTDIDHTVSALGYVVIRLMPMKRFTSAVPVILSTAG